MTEIYLKTFQALNEPLLTISENNLVQVANSNFLRFFGRNCGANQQGRKILTELRNFQRKNKF